MILPPIRMGVVYFGHIRTPNPSTSGQVTIAIAGHYTVALTISQFLKSKLEKIINTNISNSDERIRDKYKWLSNKLTEGLKKKFYFVPIEENKAE